MADRIVKHFEIKHGTQQKFDDLPVKSQDALYFITDNDTFQRKLVAGENITIDESTNTISATGGGSDMLDYVVEKQDPTLENGFTWYRKYKSGWVEQGGAIAEVSTSYATRTVSLPVEMANESYNCDISAYTAGQHYAATVSVKTTTQATLVTLLNTTAYRATWYASGMAK